MARNLDLGKGVDGKSIERTTEEIAIVQTYCRDAPN